MYHCPEQKFKNAVINILCIVPTILAQNSQQF